MIESRIVKIVERACSYYERRIPKDETMELWVERCKAIPDEAFDYILAHITDQELAPRNFPSAIWALFYAWQNANPDKKAKQEYFECPECHEGIIYARKNGYSYIFRCITCKQNRVQAYPKAYKADLEKQGFAIENPEGGRLSAEEKQECGKTMKAFGIKLPISFTEQRDTNTPF